MENARERRPRHGNGGRGVSGKAIVQTNALLVFLSSPAGGSASLRELSQRFGIEWKRVLRLLWDASLVEIEGYGLPFNLDLPPNPGEEDVGEEPTTPDSYVSFSDSGELDVPDLALTLDEVIALVAVIDSVAEITPSGDARDALAHVRATLVGAAEGAGFGSAMWDGPAPVIGDEAFAAVERALASRSFIEFTYHRPGPDLAESVTRVEAFPVEIQAAYNPLLLAVTSAGPRSYRLDRIGDVREGRKAGRAEAAAARAAVDDEAKSWSPEGQRVTVTVGPSGRWIGEALPGASMRRSGGHGGDYDVSFASTSDEFLASLLVQLGTAVRAVEPRETAVRLAKRFRGLAGAA